MRLSNSLDPDQTRHFVGPDLGQILFAKLISKGSTLSQVGKELRNYLKLINWNWSKCLAGPCHEKSRLQDL